MDKVMINIFNTTGSEFCVDSDGGQEVFNLIFKALKNEKKVELSFQNVQMLTSAFLNTAIGQLYRDFDEELIKKSLSVKSMEPEDQNLLKRVTQTAKLYYKDPDRIQKSLDEILEED